MEVYLKCLFSLMNNYMLLLLRYNCELKIPYCLKNDHFISERTLIFILWFMINTCRLSHLNGCFLLIVSSQGCNNSTNVICRWMEEFIFDEAYKSIDSHLNERLRYTCKLKVSHCLKKYRLNILSTKWFIYSIPLNSYSKF